jgi:DMSO/TMAO reductase YedYZ molybdopterin-dependent catalytic subunit
VTILSSKKQQSQLPPDQTATDRILRWGTDHPGINSTNPQLKLETYTLTIDGEVENPVKLSWNDFLQLPKTVSVSDFHCVEGWSVLDCKWEGIKIKDIERLVKPRAVARAVTFDCADNYRTSLFREELTGDDVMLAYKLNGELLEEGLGAPLRLIVPAKYAYECVVGCAFGVFQGQRTGVLGEAWIQ